MGIGVQPNCCPEPAIYTGSTKLRYFTGTSDDRIWTQSLAGPVVDPGRNYVYGADGSHITRRNAFDASDPTDLVTESVFRLVISRQENLIAYIGQDSLGGGSFKSRVTVCDLEGGGVTEVHSITNPALSGTVPVVSLAINKATHQVVFIEKELSGTFPSFTTTIRLRAVDFDGTDLTTLATLTNDEQYIPTIDYTDDHIWLGTEFELYVIDFDGSNHASIKSASSYGPGGGGADMRFGSFGVEYNPTNEKMYFTMSNLGTSQPLTDLGIWTCDPDGTGDNLEIPIDQIYDAVSSATPTRFTNFRLGEGFIHPKDVI